jgi:cyclic pyranopterin phosphate synthase
MGRYRGGVALVDPFGRTVRDLRISVTDRCNFRCTYCMPEEGMEWTPREELLTFEEIERVARICVDRFGFTSIRLTGGEPTLRARLPVLVKKLAALGVELSMTTNGTTLPQMAEDLRAAGLQRVNVSLDSLRRDRFLAMTRRDALFSVIEGIDAAKDAGFHPVKVNVVLVRGVNDDEVLDFAAFGRDNRVEVRFIEFMPLDADDGWGSERVVPSREIISAVNAEWPLEDQVPTAAPATTYRYADGNGKVGVVASVTEPFCGNCDRVRMTADGMFRNCLFAVHETDLRAVLRSDSATDDDLAEAISRDVGNKWAGHSIGQVHFTRPARTMSQIGG